MDNFWLVAKHEYRRMVFRRAFIAATFAIPLLMFVVIGITVAVALAGQNRSPVGYVDGPGLFDPALQSALPDDERVEIREYPDETSARAALEAEEIQAYFVFPATYPQSLATDIYYLEKPLSGDVWEDVDDFVRLNLAQQLPADVRARVLEGSTLVIEDVASRRTFSESSIINVILPFVATFFFMFATMSASGYMLQVVADEKENRMMEVMLTSVTPGQMIGGKAVGLLAAALTQLAIYVVAIVVGLVVAAPYIPQLQQVEVPWGYLGVMALFFFPSYALIAALMVAIGSSVSELQQGQQVAGFLNILFILPIMLVSVLFSNPSHPIMAFFTFFPTTSFMTISLRWGLGTVPYWQIGLSWLILVGSTALAIWAAARVFRAGMLHYGQPLTLKTVVAALRG